MCSTGAGDPLAVVAAALDAVSAVELTGLSDAELLGRTRVLVRLQNRVAAALAGTVRAADTRQSCEHDGLKSMQSWLRAHTRLAGPAITQLRRHGRALEHLPAVAAAFAAGRVTPDAVDVLAELARPQNLTAAAEQGIDLPAIEQALVELAATAPYRDLQTAAGSYLARLDPDGPEPDPTEGRSLTLAQHPDSSWTLGGALDAVGGTKLATALEAISAAGRSAADDRTRAQRLADALVQLADNALSCGQTPQLRNVAPHVGALIDLGDLVDPATGPGAATLTTGMTPGAVISAARARWLACDGAIGRIVLGPDSIPLDHGRTRRVVTPAQRRTLTARDRGCVFAGCEAPAWWCEAHHLLHWLHGGDTDLDNLALLCERHHAKVHHGYRVERGPDARWRTWRPDGTQILLEPSPPPRHPPPGRPAPERTPARIPALAGT